ncbi:metal-dependent transcriptional regulator [Apilactobacillus xinyiensis]|uniref:Manganese transport regulator n=1 Tax=Apilactobacillus xinyiensis TaxID=2841032 RepID=A0ABT0I0L4_9LACO|nr:metal-dependent transcriptional regulator [Apilactobacillus xinyiensis]MCK8624376.1 metal-dependent transcriptional regulator [Apilactobacillus xinyiensis]MCL0311968.1 metal-dependent transcriptional regulator [Apilactobacillus xinyiensis]MCL0318758.1 metal-dependent transcriptional regulator [Apilactobacillus xinyiensis]MCL0329634.1 metal-dependent transcriptional regulator [Apilactobacillus xinyiensis]
MTPKKEDYLKIIFELGGTKSKVTNKRIAISLDIAAGSVTEMINKLLEEGLVSHEPYSGVFLTDKGVKLAEMLVRKHRIWESFLVNALGYSLPDVDKEAEILEHVTSDKLLNALDKKLGHPTHCPHGGVIPDTHGHYKEDSHTVLNDAKDGEKVVVDRFIDNHDLLTYLGDIQLDIGDELEVIKHSPFEGPVTVKNITDKQEIVISYKASHYVFIKKVEE